MCRTAEENRVEADQLKRIDKWHQSFHVIPLHSGQKPQKIANLPISKANQFEAPLFSHFGHLNFRKLGPFVHVLSLFRAERAKKFSYLFCSIRISKDLQYDVFLLWTPNL